MEFIIPNQVTTIKDNSLKTFEANLAYLIAQCTERFEIEVRPPEGVLLSMKNYTKALEHARSIWGANYEGGVLDEFKVRGIPIYFSPVYKKENSFTIF